MTIKQVMTAKGLTSVDLAAKLGMTHQRVLALINANDAKLSTLIRLAEALECNVIDLIRDKTADNIYVGGLQIKCPNCGQRLNVDITATPCNNANLNKG